MSKIENLEGRQLLAATLLRVSGINADNRGTAVIQLSERATGVKGAAVQMYTAGPDNVLFTDDDARVSVRFTYSENKKQITLAGNLAKDTPYRIKLDGKSRIKSEASGTLLDGDNLNGSGVSGDGVAGGNYEAQFSRDKSTTPILRMMTSAGEIDVKLRGDLSAISTTVDNFIRYANAGKLDGTIYHRIVTPSSGNLGIVQGGGFYSTSEDSTTQDPNDTVTAYPPIVLQAGALSNLAGTLAMARTNDDNSATSQFYFNTIDNTALDKTSTNDGYAVFGQVTNSASSATLAKIYAGTATSFGSGNTFGAVPLVDGSIVTTYRAAVLMIGSKK